MDAGRLKLARESLSRPFPPVRMVQPLHRLDLWLGFSQTLNRDWSERLPAVATASFLLTAYAWCAGLKPVEPKLALGLGVVAAFLARFGEEK